MTVQTWQQKLDATDGIKPIVRYASGGLYYEDYNLPDGYWRYSWTNFTLNEHPEFVEVHLMEI